MNKEAKEEESKNGKRGGERRRENGDQKKVCESFSSDVFEEFSSLDGSESLGDSWGSPCGCSCGFSVRVPAGSPGVPVVMCLLLLCRWVFWVWTSLRIWSVKRLGRSPFVSPESAKLL